MPAIVRWPGMTRPGATSDHPVITMDWSATLVAAAGAKPDAKYPLDGENQLATFTGKQSPADRTFFWRIRAQGGMRSGKWKYVRVGTSEALYDLSVDEHENADYSTLRPDKLADLQAQFKAWESQMLSYPKPETSK